jgi:hypothetical protein
MNDYEYTEMVAYCKCGSKIKVRSHHGVTDKCINLFWQVRSGEGHGQASRQQAARARKAADDEARLP